MSLVSIFAKLFAVFLLLELVPVQGQEITLQSSLQCNSTGSKPIKPGRKCVDNDGACQPDGSLGNCCTGYCHKEPDWEAGYCE